MFETILLAVDGSAGSNLAIKAAAGLAKRNNSKVVVLHAFTTIVASAAYAMNPYNNNQQPVPSERLAHPHPSPSILDDEPYQQLTYKTLEAISIVEAAGTQMNNYGVTNVETRYLEGPAIQVILGEVDNLQPDLLIVGARGTGTWHGSGLGSISSALVQRAECSVFVVKPGH